MPFLAYVAIILVSLGGILFELNWLTSPKLETTPAVQVSAATPKAAPVEAAKVVDATIAPRNVAPSVTMVPAANTPTPSPSQQAAQATADEPAHESKLKGSVASGPARLEPTPQEPKPSAPPQRQANVSAAGTAPALSPTPFGSTETTGVSSPDFKREFTNDAKSDSTLSTATFTPAETSVAPTVSATSKQTTGRVQQTAPVRERKMEAAVRKPNKQAELRSFEREVRRITAREAALDTNMDRGYERVGRSQMIVIDRRDW